MQERRSTLLNAFAAAAVLGLSGWIVYSTQSPHYHSALTEFHSERSEPVAKLDEQVWELRVLPHLERSRERADESISQHFKPVVELLNHARNRTARFSEVALGFESKWRMISDYVPFTSGGSNELFLRDKFETMVLKGSDLELAIERCVEEFLQELESIEGQMLVDLRADLEDLPVSPIKSTISAEKLQASFEEALRGAIAKSSSDFQGAVGKQLVSLIAGEVMAHVAIRLGVSAGILGTGAASGWATFGIGVVAGIVIDSLVSTVWNFWSSPEEELTRQIQRQIDTLQRLICDGDEETEGLRQQFLKVSEGRSEARRVALRELLGFEK